MKRYGPSCTPFYALMAALAAVRFRRSAPGRRRERVTVARRLRRGAVEPWCSRACGRDLDRFRPDATSRLGDDALFRFLLSCDRSVPDWATRVAFLCALLRPSHRHISVPEQLTSGANAGCKTCVSIGHSARVSADMLPPTGVERNHRGLDPAIRFVDNPADRLTSIRLCRPVRRRPSPANPGIS